MSSRSRNRRGITLLEVGIVLALSSVLLSIVALLFSSLLQAQRQFSLRERQRRELARIDAILRSDGHAATTAVAGDTGTCELKSESGESWTYRSGNDGLIRERAQAGKIVQRESFQLPAGTRSEFRVVNSGSRSLLHLDLRPPEQASSRLQAMGYHGQILVGGMVPTAKEEQP
jgi:Tfp pilus assembly protein FimT